MKPKEMNKINRKIQEYKDNYQPANRPPRYNVFDKYHLDPRERNRAKRLSRKLRGKL